MAILGTLIDRTLYSRAGDDLGSGGHALTMSTLAHSLPATNPESVYMNLRSVQGGLGANGSIQLFSPGGNASILTVGYAAASQVSAPTVFVECVAIVYHSVIR